MTIAESLGQGKALLSRIPRDVLVVGIIVLTASGSFGLGVLAGRDMPGSGEEKGLWIEQLPPEELSASAAASVPVSSIATSNIAAPQAQKVSVPANAILGPAIGKYLASKNGTKYYLPTCSGAKRIKEENRIWFATVEEARAKGLTPAANCPGL